jgi:hypothetical protein
MNTSRRSVQNPQVTLPQQLLTQRGYAVPSSGVFGVQTGQALFKNENWTMAPDAAYQPLPGDIPAWWRCSLQGWLGHVGLVHSLKDGMLYAIEGYRSPRVQGFSCELSRMDSPLGFGHVP